MIVEEVGVEETGVEEMGVNLYMLQNKLMLIYALFKSTQHFVFEKLNFQFWKFWIYVLKNIIPIILAFYADYAIVYYAAGAFSALPS